MAPLCTQQTAFKMHQLTGDTPQICLSLRFQCPKAQSRTHAQSVHQNTHVVLLSIFILAFFLMLEWARPILPSPPLTPTQQHQPTLLAAPIELAPGVHHDLATLYAVQP